MKKIKVLQSIILIITVLLILYKIWMYSDTPSNRLDDVIKTTNLSGFNIVLRDADNGGIVDLTIKDNLNYVQNYTKDDHRTTIIVKNKERYYIDYTYKIISKSNTDEVIRESVDTLLQRKCLDKRGHDIIDGKLYYVEIYDNIGRTEFDKDAFYFRNGKLEYIKSSYYGNCYIESISNNIDESKFEIPEEAKNYKVEVYDE